MNSRRAASSCRTARLLGAFVPPRRRRRRPGRRRRTVSVTPGRGPSNRRARRRAWCPGAVVRDCADCAPPPRPAHPSAAGPPARRGSACAPCRPPRPGSRRTRSDTSPTDPSADPSAGPPAGPSPRASPAVSRPVRGVRQREGRSRLPETGNAEGARRQGTGTTLPSCARASISSCALDGRLRVRTARARSGAPCRWRSCRAGRALSRRDGLGLVVEHGVQGEAGHRLHPAEHQRVDGLDVAAGRAVEDQRLPNWAVRATLLVRMSPPTVSRTTSTPRPSVAALTCSSQSSSV